MQNNVDYSILIPSFKEEENLRVILPRIKLAIAEVTECSEIIVIDTCQTLDKTQDVCTANNVKYINRAPENTYGDAVRSGINYAKGKWIIFMDADGSHAPEFIPALIAKTKSEKYDVVVASRYIHGGNSENNKLLITMSKVLNFIYARILKIRCMDVSNSFRIYRGNMLRSLNLTCQNFDIVEEIIIELIKNFPNLTLFEIPYVFKKRIFGESKRSLIKFIFSYFTTLLKLIYRRYK